MSIGPLRSKSVFKDEISGAKNRVLMGPLEMKNTTVEYKSNMHEQMRTFFEINYRSIL